MRDYGNMPVVSWNHDLNAAERARAQILSHEPVIIEMPEHIRFGLCADDFRCRFNDRTGILYNCDAPEALRRLATLNAQPRLEMIEDAVRRSGAVLDIDPGGHRLIVHH